jgi:large subunit ribosomal protein L14
MIQLRTRLSIADNSGGKLGRCIRGPKNPTPGTLILVSLRKQKSSPFIKVKLKRGDVYRALLLRTTRPICRKDGTRVKFQTNDIFLLTTKDKALGTRLKGAIPYEVRKKKWLKLAALAPSLLLYFYIYEFSSKTLLDCC